MVEGHKFRGKAIDNGEWIYGRNIWYFHEDNCTDLQVAMYKKGDLLKPLTNGFIKAKPHKVDPVTVSQCTGVKDKKGVEVYRGDIVDHDAFGIREISWGSNAENNLFADMACFMFNGTIAFLSGSESAHMEVIGNIYDDPELLKR